MFTHYLKLARKALSKNRYYTLINIFGLVCGTLAALIIANYIGSSLQLDNFHEHKDQIYAITQTESVNNNPEKKSEANYWGLGVLLQQYPEVRHVTRASYHVGSLVKTEDQDGNPLPFLENRIFSVDSNFLKTFTFPLLTGNRETALAASNAMVITEMVAQKYFGKTDPIGKAVMVRVPWGREDLYEITGVLKDLPRNTRFNFDFLAAYQPISVANYWDYPSHTTYAYLDQNTQVSGLTEKITDQLAEQPALQSANKRVRIAMNSIGVAQLSDAEYLLIIIGVFILLISWVNYFNQIIAQSYARSKQIGVLKVLGAEQQNLHIQFVFESTLICGITLVLTIAIYLGLEPLLQSFTNGHLLPLQVAWTPINLLFLGVFTVGIMIAATLPMLIFATQNFGAIIKNVQWDQVGNIGLRKSLVIFQFALSTVMMISLFVISSQLEYMDKKDKGMSMNDVLIIQAPILGQTSWGNKIKSLEQFKEETKALPFVSMTASSTTVASEAYRNEAYIGFQDSPDKVLVHQNGVDEHFFELYDVAFLAGSNFIPDARFKNSKSIILNESAARNLGIYDFDEVINTQIVDEAANEAYTLIGIVKDYHKTSLKYEIGPTAFKFNAARGHISLKMNAASLAGNQFEQQLSSIRNIWEQVYQDAAFNYYFLDKQFAAQDAEDRNFGALFKWFTLLSMIISCLGLFSLSLFVSIKRQKEIGVRKVFGASVYEILLLFYKSYITPLLIAISIGAPLAYFLMNEWLENYAYRTAIDLKTMVMALLSLCLLFLLTVSYHIIKSSLANPVKILKAE